jgi:hypothetical protein
MQFRRDIGHKGLSGAAEGSAMTRVLILLGSDSGAHMSAAVDVLGSA